MAYNIDRRMIYAGLNPPKKFPAFTVKFDPQDLGNKFNPHMKHELMIAYDEVTMDNKRDKMDKESRIKSYVSDNTVNINEKNIREYTLDNHSSSMFFSNYIVLIIIEVGDRRFNVVENNNKLEHNKYFMKFSYGEFKEKINSELKTFAQYLLNYSYDETSANRTFMNEAKRRIIGSSMNMFEVFSKKLLTKDYEWLRDESGVWLENYWDLETIIDGYITKDEVPRLLKTDANNDIDFPYWVAIDKHTSVGKEALIEADEKYSVRAGRLAFYFEGSLCNKVVSSPFWELAKKWEMENMNYTFSQAIASGTS